MSSFSWLDHTDSERRRVLEAIDRMRERETRDELGFGSIRNAFADLFFPGTTVMQTRPRYFLFVPWLYQTLARKPSARADIAAALRRAEHRMIETLIAAGETDGVIGKRSRQRLLRTPSSIYWLGLRSWGICRFQGIQDDFHRHFDRLASGGDGDRDDDGELLGPASSATWDPHLPAAPAGFPDELDLALKAPEAAYLRKRIVERCADSVLGVFARKSNPVDVENVWEHPGISELPPWLRDAVEHGRLFALVTHGATLLYVLMLNERLPATEERDQRIQKLQETLGSWAAEARDDVRLAGWERDACWRLVAANGHLRPRTQRFVDTWVERALWTRQDGGAEDAWARQAVAERERQLKGPRARLVNPRALELWNPAEGFSRLDYRWPTAHRHLAEIHDAMNGSKSHAGAA